MGALGLPEPYGRIDQLIEAGDHPAAEQALGDLDGQDALAELLRTKLALEQGTVVPGAAMQRLVQLMQQDPKLPGARELYREASRRAYEHGRSSLAHSHPPPPMRGGGDDSE